MRLHGRVKMGYYPTPLCVVERIRSFLEPNPEKVTFIDPCCGEGTALQALAQGFQAETYGIELDAFRAKEAREKLTHVLKGSGLSASLTLGAFSCLYLNPPYDWQEGSSEDAPGERMEKVFLRGTAKYLQKEGLLVYVIPQVRLDREVARVLSANFENFRLYRFPDGEYEAFGQVVLFATSKNFMALDEEAASELQRRAQGELEALPFAERPLYRLPAGKPVGVFKRSGVDRETLERELSNSPLWSRFRPRVDFQDIQRPLLPLHRGHLALLMACGCLNGLVGEGKDLHVVKGKVEKFTITTTEDKGEVIEERHTERYRVSIKLLKPSGELVTLT